VAGEGIGTGFWGGKSEEIIFARGIFKLKTFYSNSDIIMNRY